MCVVGCLGCYFLVHPEPQMYICDNVRTEMNVDGLSTNYLFEYCNVTYIQMSQDQNRNEIMNVMK